jgi:hypothetical protein
VLLYPWLLKVQSFGQPGVFMRANVGGLSKTDRSRIHRGVPVIDVHAEANLQKFGDDPFGFKLGRSAVSNLYSLLAGARPVLA